MSNMDKLADQLKTLISESDDRKPKAYDTEAKVIRVDGATLWVHIPGGIDETPIKRTVNANVGDSVQIRVANGSAWATGNGTAPPTDDTQANYAVELAKEAGNNAKGAVIKAEAAIIEAEDASKVATNYVTEIDQNGIWVTPKTKKPVNKETGVGATGTKIDGTGMEIFNDGTSVAKYGNTVRIGKSEGETRQELDFRSLKLIDKEGNTFLHISDLRDEHGVTSYSETFEVADTLTFYLKVPAANTDYEVEVTDYSTWEGTVVKYTDRFTLTAWPEPSYDLYTGTIYPKATATYSTRSDKAKAYTVGLRDTSLGTGMYSMVEGYNNKAVDYAGHAEGMCTQALSDASHSEGKNTIAYGEGAHSEGVDTEARGKGHHASGVGTRALNCHTAFGKYNVDCASGRSYDPDTGRSITPVFEIGNGTNRESYEYGLSNAFEVTEDGNILLCIDSNSTAGDDYRIRTIVTTFGWAGRCLLNMCP